MANDVQINIKANTSQAQSDLKQFKSGMNDAVQSLTGFNVGSLATVGGLVAVGKALADVVMENNKYVLSIADTSDAIGMSVGDYSRLVQVADDNRMSQEQLQKALEMTTKKGYQPSIEGLAKLADELGNLTPTQRAKEMSDTFGKSWANVWKILKDGGPALIENSKNIEAGLVVTEKSVAQNELLYKRIDDLNDKFTAEKNILASQVVPGLLDYMDATMKSMDATERLKASQPGYVAQLVSIANTTRLAKEAGMGITEQGFLQASMMTGTLTPALTTNNQGWMAIPPNIQQYITSTDAARASSEQMSKVLGEQLNVYLQEYNKQLLFKIASEGLSAQSAMALAVSMGMVNEKTKFAADRTAELKSELIKGEITLAEYTRLINGMANGLDRIQSKQVMIDVYIQQHGGSDLYSGAGNPDDLNPLHRAGGGRVNPGQPYIVGEKRPELFVPDRPGTIVPSVTNNSMGGNTYNIYVTGGADELMRKLKALYGGAYQGNG